MCLFFYLLPQNLIFVFMNTDSFKIIQLNFLKYFLPQLRTGRFELMFIPDTLNGFIHNSKKFFNVK